MNKDKKQTVRSADETAQDWEGCHKDKKGPNDVDETEEDCKVGKDQGNN